ncbi:hypothetical protein [Kocuria arenosa]|uniref:hypothetical protein n=1 Tax=Kocuria arenosa TaxID=3071446 RepID=UPI0034D73265
MDLQLSVLTGTLTETNHQLLLRVLQQAQAHTAGLEVLVDLTGTTSWEASVVDLLLWEIDHSDPDGPLPPVGFVVPAPPACSSRANAVPGPRSVWTGVGRKAHGDAR